MDKAGSNKPVILMLLVRVVRIHHEGGHNSRSLKGVQAHQCGNADNDIREIQKKKDYVSEANISNSLPQKVHYQ
jgi:hypothetical protein